VPDPGTDSAQEGAARLLDLFQLGFAAAPVGTGLAMQTGMLRITTLHEGAAVVLRIEGQLQGPWVDELRHCWQCAREASGDKAVRIELVDVRFVDPAGKALLTRMHRAGTELLATGVLTTAIRDEIVARGGDGG